MRAPMEISLQNASADDSSDVNGVAGSQNSSPKIQQMVEEENNLVFVLIDIAFVDRADIKAYLGPTIKARYEMLRSCLRELLWTGILTNSQECHCPPLVSYTDLKDKLNMASMEEPENTHLCEVFLEAAEACEGLSGKSLRKLPFLAYATFANPRGCDPSKFLSTMTETAKKEFAELLSES